MNSSIYAALANTSLFDCLMEVEAKCGNLCGRDRSGG